MLASESSDGRRLQAVADLSGLTDEELMLRYRDGDVPSFDVLVRRHRNGLMSFLFRMCHDRELAAEVQADSWLRIHRAASRYEPRAKFRTYLYTVAYRRCLTALESRAHKVHAATVDVEVQDLAAGAVGTGRSSVGSDPERTAIVDEQMRRLDREVADLPEAHRAAFLLYYADGMSCEQVGEVLSLTAKEVKGRLAYARRLLRERVIG